MPHSFIKKQKTKRRTFLALEHNIANKESYVYQDHRANRIKRIIIRHKSEQERQNNYSRPFQAPAQRKS